LPHRSARRTVAYQFFLSVTDIDKYHFFHGPSMSALLYLFQTQMTYVEFMNPHWHFIEKNVSSHLLC